MGRVFTLDAIDLVLCRAALQELAGRYDDPAITESAQEVQRVIEQGDELIEPLRMLAVIALQGYAMRHGPVGFAGVVSVSRKIGLEAALRASLRNWIEFSEAQRRSRREA